MFKLRCTRPLLIQLKHVPPSGLGLEAETTTALGDWFANRLNIGRHRLVLCTSDRSLLSVIVPAKNLPELPGRLTQAVARILPALGVPPDQIARETRHMAWVELARTNSRTVLGSMNDFAFLVEHYARDEATPVDFDRIALILAEAPCSPLKYRRPKDVALELLGSTG